MREGKDITSLETEVFKDEIKELGKTGLLCNVFGHQWEETGEIILTNPPISHRVCRVCGKQQESRTIREEDMWRDDGYVK